MNTPKGNAKSMWNAARYPKPNLSNHDEKVESASSSGPQNLTAVQSSNIESVAFDHAKGLYVRFKNGSLYNYPSVSAGEHHDLMQADSLGSHFSLNIRAKHKGIAVKEDESR